MKARPEESMCYLITIENLILYLFSRKDKEIPEGKLSLTVNEIIQARKTLEDAGYVVDVSRDAVQEAIENLDWIFEYSESSGFTITPEGREYFRKRRSRYILEDNLTLSMEKHLPLNKCLSPA